MNSNVRSLISQFEQISKSVSQKDLETPTPTKKFFKSTENLNNALLEEVPNKKAGEEEKVKTSLKGGYRSNEQKLTDLEVEIKKVKGRIREERDIDVLVRLVEFLIELGKIDAEGNFRVKQKKGICFDLLQDCKDIIVSRQETEERTEQYEGTTEMYEYKEIQQEEVLQIQEEPLRKEIEPIQKEVEQEEIIEKYKNNIEEIQLEPQTSPVLFKSVKDIMNRFENPDEIKNVPSKVKIVRSQSQLNEENYEIFRSQKLQKQEVESKHEDQTVINGQTSKPDLCEMRISPKTTFEKLVEDVKHVADPKEGKEEEDEEEHKHIKTPVNSLEDLRDTNITFENICAQIEYFRGVVDELDPHDDLLRAEALEDSIKNLQSDIKSLQIEDAEKRFAVNKAASTIWDMFIQKKTGQNMNVDELIFKNISNMNQDEEDRNVDIFEAMNEMDDLITEVNKYQEMVKNLDSNDLVKANVLKENIEDVKGIFLDFTTFNDETLISRRKDNISILENLEQLLTEFEEKAVTATLESLINEIQTVSKEDADLLKTNLEQFNCKGDVNLEAKRTAALEELFKKLQVEEIIENQEVDSTTMNQEKQSDPSQQLEDFNNSEEVSSQEVDESSEFQKDDECNISPNENEDTIAEVNPRLDELCAEIARYKKESAIMDLTDIALTDKTVKQINQILIEVDAINNLDDTQFAKKLVCMKDIVDILKVFSRKKHVSEDKQTDMKKLYNTVVNNVKNAREALESGRDANAMGEAIGKLMHLKELVDRQATNSQDDDELKKVAIEKLDDTIRMISGDLI